jgi:hypothetical protein
MTVAEFLAFYPQFAGVFPEPVLTAYVASAGLRFDEFDEDAEEARRLFTAHKLTLYARTFPPSLEAQGGVSSFSALASSGDGTKITSKKVDDVAVTYASGNASSGAATGLSDLEETTYGLQLLSLIKLYGFAKYIP